MKSNFFGLSAKLALAILAVGATFTSCYDSENGDVTKPYVPAPAKYVVSGYVTDFTTGAPIKDATVTGAVSATTDATGAYTVSSTSAVNGEVTISATGYVAVKRTLKMESIETGMASYTITVALVKESIIPGMKVAILGTSSPTISFPADKNPAVDLVNNTDAAIDATLTFANLNSGARVVEGGTITKTADPALALLIEYFKAEFGIDLSAGITSNGKQAFTFEIAPFSSVKSVTLCTYGVTEAYTFVFDGKEVTYVVERVVGHSCVPKVYPNEIYHGHGHGHGHGGDLNAGGGIFE